jgi:hypothetical protein
MFSLGLADSDMSIAIESYDWQLFEPLRENRDYDVKGEISEVTRHNDKPENSGPIYDRIVFDFTVGHKGSPMASSTVIWHYRRGLT